jgi:uncharacterized protein (TIGR02453 family)
LEAGGFGDAEGFGEVRGVGGFDVEVGGASDAEAGVGGEGFVAKDGEGRNCFEGPLDAIHWFNYKDMAGKNAFRGFPAAGMEFLRELKENNDREWFTPRKEVYQTQVLAPMVELVGLLHGEMLRFAPDYVGEPKKCVFRIYRDTRFAKDKTPYKTHVAAAMWKNGGEKGRRAGFYFSVSPEEVEVGGGLYGPDPAVLLKVRQYVAEHHKAFRKTFSGELYGESAARAPKGFDPEHPAIDLIKHKHFAVIETLPPELATTPKLFPELVKRLKAITPLLDFVNRAL